MDWSGVIYKQFADGVAERSTMLETFECKRDINFAKDHVPKGQRKMPLGKILACKDDFVSLDPTMSLRDREREREPIWIDFSLCGNL